MAELTIYSLTDGHYEVITMVINSENVHALTAAGYIITEK